MWVGEELKWGGGLCVWRRGGVEVFVRVDKGIHRVFG